MVIKFEKDCHPWTQGFVYRNRKILNFKVTTARLKNAGFEMRLFIVLINIVLKFEKDLLNIRKVFDWTRQFWIFSLSMSLHTARSKNAGF